MVPTLVGATEQEFERRLGEQRDFNEEEPIDAGTWLAQHRNWIAGTPARAVDKAREFADAGCERLVLEIWLPRDLALIDLLGATFVGAL